MNTGIIIATCKNSNAEVVDLPVLREAVDFFVCFHLKWKISCMH